MYAILRFLSFDALGLDWVAGIRSFISADLRIGCLFGIVRPDLVKVLYSK